MSNSKNLRAEMLEKMVDELQNMVVQHQGFADRFVDLIDKIGYVRKSMKEQFNELKIEHNRLSGALKSLIREVNDELATKLSDFVPPVAKEFTAKVIG
jgi:DNA-directed RNA polymerase specialized sigma54-like protein